MDFIVDETFAGVEFAAGFAVYEVLLCGVSICIW